MSTPAIDDMMDDIRANASAGIADNLLKALADKVGWAARADAVFGDPVERDGVTVIPVAKVRWGFGGGAGQDSGDDPSATPDTGGGGGGGVLASPLGFIELQNGAATFRRVNDPAGYWPLVVAGGVAFWMFARGLRIIFRK